jgi:hypothetical protein
MEDGENLNEEKAKPLSMKSLAADAEARNAETDKKFDALETKLDDGIQGIMDSINAMNRPASITKDGVLSTDKDYDENLHDIKFQDVRPEDDAQLVPSRMTSIHSAEFTEKAEQMKFDNEQIEVMVMRSQATYPDHTFTLSVNGNSLIIARGVRQWIPRCYAEVMARAKTSTYGNIEIRNSQNELEVENPESRAARYPFQVMTDKSPKAGQWLERVMNDAA